MIKQLFKVALLSLFILSADTGLCQHWTVTEVAGMPEAVTNNAVEGGIVGGIPYVYSFGGLDTGKQHSGIHLRSYRYNTVADSWEQIPDLPDTLGKIAASASRVGDTIYVIGGYHVLANSDEYSSNRVHRFDINANVFLSDGADIPVAIDDQVQCVWRDSLIFVVTGWSGAGAGGTNVSNVQIYNPSLDSWSVGTALPGSNIYRAFGSSGMIIGDTIYYFGGASTGFNFPAQNYVRKGYINPADPTQVTWSFAVFETNIKGYRMAATNAHGFACWLGGSEVTYNYDGIAYNGSGGVEPVNRNLYYSPLTGQWDTVSANLPMDLRGIAFAGEDVQYLAGGMLGGQQVTNKAWKLSFDWPNALEDAESASDGFLVYPNPAAGYIAIAGSHKPETRELKIFNMLGDLVLIEQVAQGRTVDVRHLIPGIYLLYISGSETTSSIKLIISK